MSGFRSKIMKNLYMYSVEENSSKFVWERHKEVKGESIEVQAGKKKIEAKLLF